MKSTSAAETRTHAVLPALTCGTEEPPSTLRVRHLRTPTVTMKVGSCQIRSSGTGRPGRASQAGGTVACSGRRRARSLLRAHPGRGSRRASPRPPAPRSRAGPRSRPATTRCSSRPPARARPSPRSSAAIDRLGNRTGSRQGQAVPRPLHLAAARPRRRHREEPARAARRDRARGRAARRRRSRRRPSPCAPATRPPRSASTSRARRPTS